MKKVLSIILIAVILCAAFVGCAKKKQPVETHTGGGGVNLVIDPNQKDKTDSKVTHVSKNVAVKGWAEMTIPPNTTKITTVDFENPKENEGLYYQTFELLLIHEDGTKESLYKSDLIEAGKHIYEIELTRGLEVGTYKAQMFVQPYKVGSMTPTNNVVGEMTIYVK